MELMIAARKAIRELQGVHGFAVDRVYTGSFMTSLDMAGIIAPGCILFIRVLAFFLFLKVFPVLT